MTEKTLNEAIHEKLNLIAPTLKAIQGGGEQAYLGDLQTLLRKNLASLLALFERDPGLDAATADLYAAAAAIVQDATAATQPYARKRRLLQEAQARFEERIALARCQSASKFDPQSASNSNPAGIDGMPPLCGFIRSGS